MTQPKKLGTFLGVFTPTVLTILGVIMFMRMGWVVGESGLGGALLVVVLANVITLITTLSMSSLATNMKVGVGGAYFLISRSFGLEVGGAIGIPLYLSQVLSLTLYAFGLAESFRIVWPSIPVPFVAALIVVAVTMVASKSTELTLKLQLPIMVLIAASLLSLYLGVSWEGSQVPLFTGYGPQGFWGVFAVFFPAVTGILTGLSLSGDLETPSTSIPLGALAATAVGAVVYLTLPFALANGAPSPEALSDSLVWTQVAAVPWLVMPGLWGAILSSAFGSILSAPRTLQALSNDELAPRVFAQVDEDSGEPLLGLRVSGALALVAVALGDLNAVASWVTVFFLTTYGALNLVAALESLIGDTSFRPTIRVPWFVSLLGGLGCLVAMFAINPLACVVAVVVEAGIFYLLSRRTLQATWGDARSGLLMTGARFALMMLKDSRVDPRNWRPHIIVFTTGIERTLPVIRVADLIGQHRGIVTVVRLLEGDVEDHADADLLLARDNRILEGEGLSAFCEVTAVPELDRGVLTVSQANGIAGLHSNTAMFGYHRDQDGPAHLARLLRLGRRLTLLEMCTLIHKPAETKRERDQGAILVWWAGRENNGDLMLLIAHLLQRTHEYGHAGIQLKSIVRTEEEAREMRRDVASMLPEIRIHVDLEVLVKSEEDSTRQLIAEHSRKASIVLLGLRFPEDDASEEYAERFDELLAQLPDVLMVRNAGPFRGRLV